MASNRLLTVRGLVASLMLALAMLACNAIPSTPAPTLPASPLPATFTPGSELVTPARLSATTIVETNVRTGPGTDYPILGTLKSDLPIQLTGRNADKSWFQFEFSASPSGRAWISAGNVTLTPGSNAEALPIIDVPPAPTPTATLTPTITASPPPTQQPSATPTRKPPTATPRPTTTPVFRADKTQLAPGECTTLRWDVDNVKAVFLDVGRGEEPVIGHDTRQVCPDVTTNYKLRVIYADDTAREYILTINVSGQCGNVPIIARFETTATTLKKGQSAIIFWDVVCAQAVFFKEGAAERQPVTGHDQREVRPTETTTYRLIVIAADGSEFRQELTITVNP